MPGGHTCHLVQHCEAAVNFFSGGPVLLDGAGQVLAEAGVKEVIVIPDLETGFGEEIGEILLQILVHALQAGSRVAVSRRFDGLHLSFKHLSRAFALLEIRHHTSQRGRMLRSEVARCNRLEKKMRSEFSQAFASSKSGVAPRGSPRATYML